MVEAVGRERDIVSTFHGVRAENARGGVVQGVLILLFCDDGSADTMWHEMRAGMSGVTSIGCNCWRHEPVQ